VRLYVSFTGANPVKNVSIVVNPPRGVIPVPANVILDELKDGGQGHGGLSSSSTPLLLTFALYASSLAPPEDLTASFSASYFSSNGEPRSISHEIQLPMLLACRVKPATKSAPLKLVLSTDDLDAIPLTELFDDYLLSNQEAGLDCQAILGPSANMALGLMLYAPAIDIPTVEETLLVAKGEQQTFTCDPGAGTSGGGGGMGTLVLPIPRATASVLASKQGGRYRVQADCPWALAFAARQLEQRLRQATSEGGSRAVSATSSSGTRISYTDDLPLQDFNDAIDKHFAIRVAIKDLASRLNDSSHQYRVIQKRLLNRYKDKNPTPLGGLDVLIKETYDEIIALSDRIMVLTRAQVLALANLESRARLLSMLICLKFTHLTYADRLVLEAHLSPLTQEGEMEDGAGWEETVDASLNYLLMSVLARSSPDTSALSPALEMPVSCDKLKKHIAMVIDRLSKGSSLTLASASSSSTLGSSSSHK